MSFVLFYPTDSGHGGQHKDESDKSTEVDGMKECGYPIQLSILKSDDAPRQVIMPVDTKKVSLKEYTPESGSVIYDTVRAPKI